MLPIAKNAIIDIDITSYGSEAQGIGHVDGLAVFVDGALAGETVRARIIKMTTSYAVGKLLEVLTPSPERIEPPCGAFEKCGGCTLLNLSYPAQLRFKQQKVTDALERIGGISNAALLAQPIIGMESPFRYRNKGAFPATQTEEGVRFGLFSQHSHRVVPVDDCLLQREVCAPVIHAVEEWADRFSVPAYDEFSFSGTLRHIVIRTAQSGKTMVVIVTTGALPRQAELVEALKAACPSLCSVVHNINAKNTNVIMGDRSSVISDDSIITETLAGLKFNVDSYSFLQVNHAQTELLYACALDSAELTQNSMVIDAYCGIGTMTLAAAQRCKFALGIESVPQAIENARENARINGIENVRFITGECETVLQSVKEKPDVIIADPPRKGCEPAFLTAAASLSPKRIIYVSCNPSTLARDVKLLGSLGYVLRRFQPFDLFPHTPHVEAVATLTRRHPAI